MEIIVVMALTIIRIVTYFIQAMLVVGIIGAVVFGIGLGYITYFDWKDRQSRKVSDDGDYFEEPHAEDAANKKLCDADALRDPQSEKYWREMDRLNDRRILENTKDL